MGLYARVDAAAAASDRREAGERSGRTGTSLPIASHRHTPTAPSRAASVLRSLRLRSNPCVWSIESHVCGPRALPARSLVAAAAPSRPMTLRAQTVQAVTSLRAKLIKAHAWRIGSVPTQLSLSVASQPRPCRRLGSAIGVGPTAHDAASAPATELPVAPLPSWREPPTPAFGNFHGHSHAGMLVRDPSAYRTRRGGVYTRSRLRLSALGRTVASDKRRGDTFPSRERSRARATAIGAGRGWRPYALCRARSDRRRLPRSYVAFGAAQHVARRMACNPTTSAAHGAVDRVFAAYTPVGSAPLAWGTATARVAQLPDGRRFAAQHAAYVRRREGAGRRTHGPRLCHAAPIAAAALRCAAADRAICTGVAPRQGDRLQMQQALSVV